MDVVDFVRAASNRDPRAGDCCRTADEWIRHACGFSPTQAFGRELGTAGEIAGWLSEPGGIAVAVNRVMRTARFRKTREPVAGDVALVLYGGKIFAAIHTGEHWFSRDDTGLILAPLTAPFKAWNVQCRKP